MIVNQNMALIDKMVLNNLLITDISDMDYLIDLGVIEVNPTVYSYQTDGGDFSHLKIKQDGNIDKLTAGILKTGKTWHTYCNLHTSVHHPEGNLTCNTVQDYQKQVIDIQTALRGKYGVEIDTEWATLKQIEINRTIKLQDDFNFYHRVLHLIMFNLPYPFAKQMDFKRKIGGELECDTYYATTKKKAKSKKYTELKIYNKSKQIQQVITVSDGWMRVELKIVGAAKIRAELGTNDLSTLTDTQINDYFDRMMQKLIVQPYRKWQQQQKKEIKKIMQEQRKINLKRWQIGTLTHILDAEIDRQCPVALDIQQILEVVPELKDVPVKYVKSIQGNINEQAGKCASVLCNYDGKRMEEIISKLTSKENAH